MAGAIAALETVDAFLGGVLQHLGRDVLIIMASDHGNIEDVRSGHTRNPALGIAAGPEAERAGRLRDIRDVAPFLVELSSGRLS
jgi:phosphopentomutase